MVSLGRATFGLGLPQSSDCETLSMAEGPPSLSGVWGIPSSNALAVCKEHIDRNSPSSAPFVHTGHIGPVWVFMGLVVQEKPASQLVVSEQTKPLQSFAPFAYFSPCVQHFWPYTYY